MLPNDQQLDPTNREPAGSAGTLPLLGDFGSEADVDEFDVGYDSTAEGKQLVQQSALLIGLVTILAVGMLAGMQLFGGSDGGDNAETEIASIEDFIRKSQNPTLVAPDDPQHPDRVAAMFSDADRIVQKISMTFPEKRVQAGEIAQNPFARPELISQEAPDSGAAERRRRERLIALRTEADALNLQSIMGSGERSVAVIDGDFYRTGQALGAFRVGGIDGGRVALVPLDIEMRPTETAFELSIEAEISRAPMQRF